MLYSTRLRGHTYLDVIVEHAVQLGVEPVTVQVVEGLLGLKILKLDNHVGVDLLDGVHDLVAEVLLLLDRGTLGAQTKVERVAQVLLL